MTLSLGSFLLSVGGCAILAVAAGGVASAEQIYTNNMSDTSVQLTAYDASKPAKVIGTWCVDTGNYEMHELKAKPNLLHADVMHEGCKEPVYSGRDLTTVAGAPATLFRLTGLHGKYVITGPFSHDLVK